MSGTGRPSRGAVLLPLAAVGAGLSLASLAADTAAGPPRVLPAPAPVPAPAPAVHARPPGETPSREPAKSGTTGANATPGATEPTAAEAEAMLKAVVRLSMETRRELGEGFAVLEDPPFVIAGNVPATRLETLRREVIRRGSRALWEQLFRKRPDKPVRILVMADEVSYRATARRLYGDEDVARFGYWRPDGRTVLADLSTGDGTVMHELTHALMAADFPEAPDWYNEGLASLFEQSRFEKAGGLRGLVNWRLPALKKAAAGGKLPWLGDLMSLRRGRFYADGAAENYAQARYFCLFLQSRGVLAKFHAAFRDGLADDPTGAAQAVAACGAKDLDSLQREFLKWVETLPVE